MKLDDVLREHVSWEFQKPIKFQGWCSGFRGCFACVTRQAMRNVSLQIVVRRIFWVRRLTGYY